MGGKGSTPPAPDYKGAAQEQAASSREATTAATWANRPTQNTPFGSSTWNTGTKVDPSTGQNVTTWEENITLDPATKQALDSQQALQQQRSDLAGGMFERVGQELGPQMDWSQYGSPTGLNDTASSARENATRNAMEQFSSRADPRYARAEDQTRTRLANQGITEGSEAYRRAMQDFGQSKEDAYRQAEYQAQAVGGSEGQRQLGMEATTADYSNKIRQQQITEEMQKRGFSLNEINALISGQQVGMPGMPQFGQAGTSQAVNAMGAAGMTGQSGLDAYNAQQGQAGQTMATVGTVAGIAAMAF